MSTQITKQNFAFLKKLAKNNNREWFADNKPEYLTQHENTIGFADALLAEMQKHDNIETVSGKKSLYRIYRDTRFSKDKTPYKTHWGGYFKRATALLRGGYYFHIEAGNSFIGGGFWQPNSDDMKRIRQEIASDPDEFRKIITHKTFVKTFGELEGEQLKTAPKGYPKDHPAIDLLRYKQFLMGRKFTDAEVMSPNFVKEATKVFLAMRPFFDYMSEVLTTDENGESLFE